MLCVSKCSRGSSIYLERKARNFSENEMPGIRGGVQKGETYNKYGGDARRVEIEVIKKTWYVRENTFLGSSGRGPLIEGRFVYNVGNKPISDCHIKTGATDDENRKLEARLRFKGFQEFAATNASAPTVQLQIIRLFLAVIEYPEMEL